MLAYNHTALVEPALSVPRGKAIGPVKVVPGSNSPDYYWPIRAAMEKELVKGIPSTLAGTPPHNQNGMDCLDDADYIEIPNTLITSKGAILLHARILEISQFYHYYFAIDGAGFALAWFNSGTYFRFYMAGSAVNSSTLSPSVGDKFVLLAMWDDTTNARIIWCDGQRKLNSTTSFSIPAFTNPLEMGTRTDLANRYSGLRVYSVGLWDGRWPTDESGLTLDPYQFVRAA